MWVRHALWDSHVVERRRRPETALGSPGQPVPGVFGEVAIAGTAIRRLIILVLQTVKTHEGQLLELCDISSIQ